MAHGHTNPNSEIEGLRKVVLALLEHLSLLVDAFSIFKRCSAVLRSVDVDFYGRDLQLSDKGVLVVLQNLILLHHQ
jgi:hypothetical protein